MADHQNEMIQNFVAVTGADPQAARHYLEASNWNLETATQQFYDTDEAMGEGAQLEDDDDELYSAPQQGAASSSAAPPASSSSSKKAASKPKSKFATLGDLRKSGTEDDDDSEDEKQDLFAGGEKSGLAVQNPGDRDRRGNLIQDILKRAAEGGRHRHEDEGEEEAAPATRFTGTGHTLGSEDAPSVEIPDSAAPRPTRRETVTRTLTFWRDGFSVEDGPLYRYNDPANQEILRAIENGRAPLSLMNVEPGQPADVNVFKRLDEDYVAPKKKFQPFSGSGNRLGSLTPGESLGSSSSSSAAPAAAPPAPAAAAAAATPPPPTIDIDTNAPTTQLQIRLGDGTRLVSRFNHTHTVQDVYGFVNASSVASRSRDYVLQTTFPNKELKDMGQTIKDAGLINAVVVQKWA